MEFNEANCGRELGWDEAIEEGDAYLPLPEGEYDFEVIGFDRGRHPGSARLTPCYKAMLRLRIDAPEGRTTLRHTLYLHTQTQGLLCAFFASIGLRQHGVRAAMDWSRVAGARGRVRVSIRQFIADSGEEMAINDVRRFLPMKAEGAL